MYYQQEAIIRKYMLQTNNSVSKCGVPHLRIALPKERRRARPNPLLVCHTETKFDLEWLRMMIMIAGDDASTRLFLHPFVLSMHPLLLKSNDKRIDTTTKKKLGTQVCHTVNMHHETHDVNDYDIQTSTKDAFIAPYKHTTDR